MVDISYLKKHGCSSGAYRKLWTMEPAEYPPRLKKLWELISARIRDGRTKNLTEYRSYAAIDLATSVDFSQTTATLVHHIMGQHLDADQTLECCKQWGLSKEDMFLEITAPTGGTQLVLNPPVFFQIFLPVCLAYLTIRQAKIFNERNTSPLLSYTPLKQTNRDQLLCEIVTDLVNTTSTQYGYASVLRQAIQQMLKYGVMLAFPREEWDCQHQMEDDGSEKGKRVTVKEGIRYNLPHPTRMFYDLMYPLTSFNTDSGCEYAGHWYVVRYSDILDNPKYWNRKNIYSGTNWFQADFVGNYFTEIYPCVMKFPHGGFGPPLREDKSAWYNTMNGRDNAVFLTEMFMRLTPKTWGLGDYPYPVWHRFTVAGDDTILWSEPCAYNPVWFMGFDYDEQAGLNTSLVLQTIPFQDHLGNILSQMILTAKQNLANVIFYDTNLVSPEQIKKLENLGERRYRAIQYVPFDSQLNQRIQLNYERAFVPVQLSKASIQELLQMIPTILSIMERVLQISAQEAGSAASHQQSKAEIVQTAGATGQRLVFTSSFVDEGIDAWKQQQYEATMAYKDAGITAQVSADIPDLDKHLAELGLEVEQQGQDKVSVKGHKRKLKLEGFAASNKGPEPDKNAELSQIIYQTIGVIAGQEDLHKAIGTKNLITLIEEAAKLAGAPKDFRLTLAQKNGDGTALPPELGPVLHKLQLSIMQAVEQKIASPVAKEMAQTQQEIAQLQAALKAIQPIIAAAKQATDRQRIETAEATQRMTLEAKEFEQEQLRKDAQFQQEQRQKEEKHQQDMREKSEKAALDKTKAVTPKG